MAATSIVWVYDFTVPHSYGAINLDLYEMVQLGPTFYCKIFNELFQTNGKNPPSWTWVDISTVEIHDLPKHNCTNQYFKKLPHKNKAIGIITTGSTTTGTIGVVFDANKASNESVTEIFCTIIIIITIIWRLKIVFLIILS